jgi:hypothetical protein
MIIYHQLMPSENAMNQSTKSKDTVHRIHTMGIIEAVEMALHKVDHQATEVTAIAM